MPNNLQSFGITVDDVDRARRFYEQVFTWRFEPWGPPGFDLIHTGDDKNPGVQGLMHKRREPVNGTGMTGFKCTIEVRNIDETIRAIETNGGNFGGGTVCRGVCSERADRPHPGKFSRQITIPGQG